MKTRSPLLLAAAFCSIVGLTAGCAATSTQQSTGQVVDSAVITSNVKTALAKEQLATLLDIEVETFRDVVQLSGFVDSDAERLRAGEIAASVEGVGTVENDLVVKPAT